MRIVIFSGLISLNDENHDVRKKYILDRLKYLNHHDIFIEIVTPKVNYDDLPKVNNFNYNMYFIVNRPHFKIVSTLVFSFSKLIKLNCDVIHCYGYYATIIAVLANIFRKTKYLILFEPMGLAYEEAKIDERSSKKVRLAKYFINLVEKIAFEKSDGIIVYTKNFKEYVSQKYKVVGKIYIINHGVDLNIPYVIGNLESNFIRNKLNIPSSNKIIMYTGLLSELHGLPYLMEAIRLINKKRHDTILLILGKGVLEHNIKKYIKNNNLSNVLLLGFIPHKKIPLYLSLADVLVIPHSKCLQTEIDPPTKLFEYLASGKPIVSFNLSAISEIVKDNALFVEPDNPNALADGILTVLNNEELATKISNKSGEIVKFYSWENASRQQYEMYKSLY